MRPGSNGPEEVEPLMALTEGLKASVAPFAAKRGVSMDWLLLGDVRALLFSATAQRIENGIVQGRWRKKSGLRSARSANSRPLIRLNPPSPVSTRIQPSIGDAEPLV